MGINGSYTGSSPRVWGQVYIFTIYRFSTGIIPTRVGTRTLDKKSCLRYKDHPHACGDKKKDYNLVGVNNGSSPRVWGQAVSILQRRIIGRIIPTRVGTRLLLCLLERFYWDHPHACGDKFQNVLQTLSLLGSSPRVWGQVLLLSYLFHGVRIIPTRVGTSLYICVRFSHKQDHPHACGDKAVAY